MSNTGSTLAKTDSKTKRVIRASALLAAAAAAAIPGLVAYGAFMNYTMHQTIESEFSRNAEIRARIGIFRHAKILSSGCEFKLTCTSSFQVSGDTGCIWALVVTTESFPNYEMLSVSPEKYTSTTRSNGGTPVTAVEVRRCL
ncbi:hypothetical protein [Acidovorax sp. Root275]|uniref:hypothetical protein n=1 Tax=Acidovorax sp. Root275 TaxID=1736508 RepID=UPI001124E5E5|nr:hypothetical protein [Acidovorax sp. Root275]